MDVDADDVHAQRFCPSCVAIRSGVFPLAVAIYHAKEAELKHQRLSAAMKGTGWATLPGSSSSAKTALEHAMAFDEIAADRDYDRGQDQQPAPPSAERGLASSSALHVDL